MNGYNAESHASNIIVTLSGLPDFLRRPMLKMRMSEFPRLSAGEQDEIVGNALDASPGIPFPAFAKLFETWLEVLAEMGDVERRALLAAYARGAAAAPVRVAALHMDGLVGVFAGMGPAGRETLLASIRQILEEMEPGPKRRLLLLMPDTAKEMLGV